MKTVLLWGAGATASLGMATTKQQNDFWKRILKESCEHRVHSYRELFASEDLECFLGRYATDVADLLTLLDDDIDESQDGQLRDHGLVHLSKRQKELLGKYAHDLGGEPNLGTFDSIMDKAHDRLVMLRVFYDWSALLLILKTQRHLLEGDVCKGRDDVDLVQRVYNIIDASLRMHVGFRADVDPKENRVSDFLGVDRLQGARNAFILMTNIMFACAYHHMLDTGQSDSMRPYTRFMDAFVENLAQSEAGSQTGNCLSVVSFNYDPLFWWLYQSACIRYNRAPCYGEAPARPINVGYCLSVQAVRESTNSPDCNVRYSQELVDQAKCQKNFPVVLRSLPIYYPHGCLNWRTCPCCGLTFLCQGGHPDQDLDEQLFAPGFIGKLIWPSPDPGSNDSDSFWNQGERDVIGCPRCGAPTEWRHCDIIPQSGIKPMPSSFLQQEYYNVSAELMSADHVVMLGYRLPPDDALWAATVAARVTRANHQPVRCSVVDLHKGAPCRWYKPSEFPFSEIKKMPESVANACRVFGSNNVRVNLAGAPAVFKDGDPSAIQELIWPRLKGVYK